MILVLSCPSWVEVIVASWVLFEYSLPGSADSTLACIYTLVCLIGVPRDTWEPVQLNQAQNSRVVQHQHIHLLFNASNKQPNILPDHSIHVLDASVESRDLYWSLIEGRLINRRVGVGVRYTLYNSG